MNPIVFIIDDDRDVRSALALLMTSAGFAYETFDSAWSFLSRFDIQQSGVLVLDIRMRDMTGLELQERLAQETYHPPIIMITGHGEVPVAVRAVKAGAIDFLEKPFNDEVLLNAIRRGFALDAEYRYQTSRQITVQQRLQRLTPREREVLDLIIAGKRNKVIAADLGISQSTVEAHRAKVMDKLEARSVSELMRMMLA
ncbi:response regulator transcription factor [Rhodopseudomonas palustris]|uniref:Response regulator transcription factor n=1 Tax=Thiospirillum jenense TaxID=1653858 RepID=A0A839H4S6_9GAMM|nr:response regulator [Thiospirillum jenense]MBB1089701.1 response regulator transcription factor [Rhodopseudomonas palustris]MBB1124801.1 response regulator transcription factor [Thiospirillum jenense]